MALTRKLLKGMGLTEEQIDSIIDAHTDTVDALKGQLKEREGDAAKIAALEKEIEGYKGAGAEDWQEKYNGVKKELDDFKSEVAGKEAAARAKSAYKELLKGEKIDPRRFDVILRATDLSGVKLDKDGQIENADTLKENIRKEWSDFIVSSETRGADVGNPPAGGGASRSKAEIMAIKDTAERQRAIAENHQLFGF